VSVVSKLLQRERSAADVTIERMRRRHLRMILPIETQVYPRPWSPSVFLDELNAAARGERVYIVAKSLGRVVGYAGMILGVDEIHVTNIAVQPERQRGGIGRRMLLYLLHEARARGYQAMTLEVRVSNHAAQAMYQRFGFAPAGVRKKYYEQTEDAIVMWAHDIHTPEFAERLAMLEAQ
jgi:ribosomal-protein-alanine N-acetyltransferase